jgi:3-oxoadipate enol-lactonase
MDLYDHDLERGLRNRRKILGDAWVDKSLDNATAFTADFQCFITHYAWHEVWGRPGLSAKSRRFIVLAIACALGRWEEFELHLRAALTGGSGESLDAGDDAPTALTSDEVKELLMQTAIYAGVPAANTGMHIAAKVMRELELSASPQSLFFGAHPGTGRSWRTASQPSLHCTLREPRNGRTARRTVVLSHALGCDASLWDALANALALDHRVICHDHRGHGASDSPQGPYTMAQLADDAERLLAELDAGPVVWVGLSLGGMVGQELALRHPQRVETLVIANSCAAFDEVGRAGWTQRIETIEREGLEAIADMAMQRWFCSEFRVARPATVERWRRRVVSTATRGYLGCCHAIREHDTRSRLHEIRIPTLVVAGAVDEATPVSMSEALCAGVPGAQLTVLEGTAHLSVLERPAEFADAVRGFLDSLN